MRKVPADSPDMTTCNRCFCACDYCVDRVRGKLVPVESLKEAESPTASELLRRGGEWLGAARNWLRRHMQTGPLGEGSLPSESDWRNVDEIRPTFTVAMVEDLASEVAAAAMRPQPTEQRVEACMRARWKAEAERDEALAAHDALARVVGQALIVPTLADGEDLVDPSDHAIVGAMLEMRKLAIQAQEDHRAALEAIETYESRIRDIGDHVLGLVPVDTPTIVILDAIERICGEHRVALAQAEARVRELENTMRKIANCNSGEGYMPELAREVLGGGECTDTKT